MDARERALTRLRPWLADSAARDFDTSRRLLPAWCYGDVDVASAERARLYDGWHCLGHMSELKAGAPLARMVGSTPLFLQRGSSGEPFALSGICRHRGMPVVANLGHRTGFVCPFHGWAYDAEGMLRQSADCGGCVMGLQRHAVDEVGGWLFVSLSPPNERAQTYVDDVLRGHPWSELGDLTPFGPPIVRTLSFDWKLLSDNAGDAYHFLGTHRNSVGRYLRAAGTQFTHGRHWHALEIPARAGQPHSEPSYSLHLYPHVFLGVSDGFVYLERFETIEPRAFQHVIQVFRTTHASALEADVLANSMMAVMEEDYEACRILQQTYASAPVDAQARMLATSLEEGVWRWQQWWLRRVCLVDAPARTDARPVVT